MVTSSKKQAKANRTGNLKKSVNSHITATSPIQWPSNNGSLTVRSSSISWIQAVHNPQKDEGGGGWKGDRACIFFFIIIIIIFLFLCFAIFLKKFYSLLYHALVSLQVPPKSNCSFGWKIFNFEPSSLKVCIFNIFGLVGCGTVPASELLLHLQHQWRQKRLINLHHFLHTLR